MVEPSCYVISAADWHQLVKALALGTLLVPITQVLIATDWLGWLEFFRRRARRRRLRAIREARRG